MPEYLKDLNDVQREAVLHSDGPSLIIAGAGSGKTRVLTYRIAHLLAQNVSPWSILALTFTNKAANEMKERISNLVGEDKARQLWMGTFHSLFSRILRNESDKLGYPQQFTIYDTIDSKSIIKSIVKELHLDDKTYPAGEILSRISAAKNNLLTPVAYCNSPQISERDMASKKPELGRIYKIYAQRCYKSGAMDFDDLLMNTNILFRDFPEVLAKYQDKFKYILVDEYQDTNYSQYLIIKKLSAHSKNISVVGDDSQSIYAFRGARIENILNFKKDYTDCRIFKLEQNYRSTKTIVEAANSLIAKNNNRLPKTIWSGNETGGLVSVLQSQSDVEEGYKVTGIIQDTHNRDHYRYNEYAILYRTNAQSRVFEEALRRRNIPYRIYGGLSFYQRKEIKDILAYFRLVINPKDEESLLRIINYPARGIGKTTIEKIEKFCRDSDLYMWDVISNPQNYPTGVSAATNNKLFRFSELIKSFIELKEISTAYDLATNIIGTVGILTDLSAEKTPENISRFENVHELLNGLKDLSEEMKEQGQELALADYMANVSLMTNEDNDKEADIDKVTLMTVHSAKGLEFKNVFIVGVEKDLFPSAFSSNSMQELEEERRLFYVAITRAEKNAYISYAMTRYRFGKLSDGGPSRFIREIDPRFLNWQDSENRPEPIQSQKTELLKGTPYRSAQNLPKQEISNFTPDDPDTLSTGMKIIHNRFGKGKIISIEGDGENRKATVYFISSGQKQLLLKYAKLKMDE